jgi:hypothetical protein
MRVIVQGRADVFTRPEGATATDRISVLVGGKETEIPRVAQR